MNLDPNKNKIVTEWWCTECLPELSHIWVTYITPKTWSNFQLNVDMILLEFSSLWWFCMITKNAVLFIWHIQENSVDFAISINIYKQFKISKIH